MTLIRNRNNRVSWTASNQNYVQLYLFRPLRLIHVK